MRKLKGISTFIVLVLLLQGCMPDSLTKFKEAETKSEEVASGVEAPDLLDGDGNPIEADALVAPVSVSYDDQVIVSDVDVDIVPGGSLNDLEVQVDIPNDTYELIANMETNYSPNYTIVPALPTGLTLNTVTGVIFGAPVAPVNLAAYTITLTYTDPTSLATVTLNDTFNLTIEEEIPADFRITYNAAVVTKKLGLELGTNENFLSGVTTISSKNGATGTLVLADASNSVFIDVTAGEFLIADEIDNNGTYIAPESTVSTLTYFFATNATVDLIPMASSTSSLDSTQNSVTYEILPDLPTGLTLNTSTGAITGTVATSVASTEHTYKISNSQFTQSYKFSLAITEAPRALSHTNSLVLEVSDPSNFEVGSAISANFTPPLTAGGLGEVLFKQGNTLIIRHISGSFENGQAIDNFSSYIDEETKIASTPEQVTSVISVADGTVATLGDYNSAVANFVVCQQDGGNNEAKGTITKLIEDGDGNGVDDADIDLIFVTQTKALAGTDWDGEFADGIGESLFLNTTCDALNVNAPVVGIGVTSVWSPSMRLTGTATTGFKDGYDLITNNLATAYISDLTATDFYISPTSATFIDSGDIVDYSRPYNSGGVGTQETTTAVRTNLKFELKRGEEVLLTPFLAQGEDINYSTDVDLPKGLTIDEKTGVISGTPEETTTDSEYQITAQNIISSETVRINIQIIDYIEITEVTNAPTYALHKTEQANTAAKCRVTKEDIDEFAVVQDPQIVDIECFMDGGESDIYNLGLNLKVDAGPGVCEFVSFQPFSFWQYPPAETDSNLIAEVTEVSCTDAVRSVGDFYVQGSFATGLLGTGVFAPTTLPSTIDKDNICEGLYDSGTINCDSGSYTIQNVGILDDGADGDATCDYQILNTATVDCNGKVRACLQGPVREIFTASEIEDSGVTSEIVASDDGLQKTYTFKAPIVNGYASNRSLVNHVRGSSCSSESSPTEYTHGGLQARGNSGNASTGANAITTPMLDSSPYYTFNCLDGAYDLKARIRVVVRDWNRNFNKSSSIDSYFASFLDDNSTDPFGISYNNRGDWDDYKPTYYEACTDSVSPLTAGEGGATVTAPVNAFHYIAATGNAATTAGSTTVTGTGTTFNTELAVGDWVAIGSSLRRVTGGLVAGSFTVNTAFYNTMTAQSVYSLTATGGISAAPSLSYTIGTNTLDGTNTRFLSTLTPGARITLSSGQVVIIDSVANNTEATITGYFNSTNAADATATIGTGMIFPGLGL
mgnify:CR=1 FL=1